jgi:hypothetical protein
MASCISRSRVATVLFSVSVSWSLFEISKGGAGAAGRTIPRFHCQAQRYWRDEALAPLRNSLDIERLVSRVAQSFPQLHDCSIQAMVEVNEGV